MKGVVQQITSKSSAVEKLLPNSMRTKVFHELSGRRDKRITITNRNPEKPPLIEDQPGNLLFDSHQDQGNGCYINKRLDIGVSMTETQWLWPLKERTGTFRIFTDFLSSHMPLSLASVSDLCRYQNSGVPSMTR